MNFEDFLKEQFKNPDFKKGYQKEKEKSKLELKFNKILQKMGHKDLCVEVLEIDEY